MKKCVVLLVMLALLVETAHAQENNGRVEELGGGYVITVPEGWEVSKDEDVYAVTNGDLSIHIMTPDAVAELLDLSPDADVTEVLIEAHYKLSEQTLDRINITVDTLDDRAVAFTEFIFQYWENETRMGISMVIEVVPGQFGVMEFTAPTDDYDEILDTALAIVRSLQLSGESASADSHEGGMASVSIEPCAVRARRAQVELRVGPGPNRAIYREMEQGSFVPVLGKATASDDSLWWRLDTDTDDANELWVADADVEQQGACQYVMDVAAPPIIPALPRPPAPADNTGGENPPPTPSGLVMCPIVNESTFTIKGTISGPGGPYSFEIRAGDYVILMVEPGDYTANFFCDGCGNLGATNIWPCNGYTYIRIGVR
jgi:hypothetical protein